jgi:hypothetical protein
MNRRVLHMTSSEIAISLLMFTGRIEGRLLHFGSIPPSAGPRRLLVLHTWGAEELRSAKVLYGKARDRLDCPVEHHLDSPHAPWWFHPPITMSSAVLCSYAGRRGGEVERLARDALSSAVRAFNLLEDFPEADDAHRLIHELGMFVSRHFGCEIVLKEGLWRWSCPVIMSHLRFGQSAGFTAKRICSICGEGIMSDRCPHMLSQTYKVAVEDVAHCPCGSENCTRHQLGTAIEAYPTVIINEADLEETSWVARPRDPLARIRAVSYTTEQMTSLMGGAEIPPVMEIIECFHCRQACTGLWDFETLGELLKDHYSHKGGGELYCEGDRVGTESA